MAGDIDVMVDLDFGFNSRGLTDPALDPLDGLFIVDADGAEVQISSTVALDVALNLGLAGVSGGGDITGIINMELINGTDPGRLYYDEFIAALTSNPFGIFTGTGEISLGFAAALKALGAEVWRWTSPRITLASFSFGGASEDTDWNLGVRTGGSYLLNIGTRAINRTDPADDVDRGERITISMAADGETLQVQLDHPTGIVYRNDTASGISKVNAYGGQGDDEVIMAEAMQVQANFAGGAGNDLLAGGDLVDTLTGGAGNDVLFGYRGADLLSGGGGNDLLNGGQGSDTLDGGAGTDRASYVGSTSGVIIDFVAGAFGGGHAAGDVLISIESVDGSEFNDVITGSPGAGQFFGMGGDDTLTGGTHAQLLAGGAGNDRLVAGRAMTRFTGARAMTASRAGRATTFMSSVRAMRSPMRARMAPISSGPMPAMP